MDLTVSEGDVHALVGPSRAGKATLFTLLTGFLKPSTGQIRFGSRDTTGSSSGTRLAICHRERQRRLRYCGSVSDCRKSVMIPR
ncbi:ATP-binding cassette domain-containing protein [Kribbella sp. NPDC023972]|uniref:ATP-binding cassette domain-containing protein n=1 Tax=Kribbella sp. NPDC023972 TaxID=3154795 RepID=UPI0033E667A2